MMKLTITTAFGNKIENDLKPRLKKFLYRKGGQGISSMNICLITIIEFFVRSLVLLDILGTHLFFPP